MKNLILILVFVTLFIACKKQHTVTIQAQNLTNLSDGSHYAGMKYIVVERRVGTFENKYKTVEEGFLDENGYANFDLKMHPNRTYDLGIEKPDNICYTEVTIKYHLKSLQSNVVNFNYGPCGYYMPLYKNINCEGADDKMQFKYYYSNDSNIYIYTGYTAGANHEWNDLFYIEGCADNTNLSNLGVFDIPNGNYTIKWRVIRPSGTTTGIDYFTVTESDTTTYILEY